ncbi:hypothetical protein K490DRAFT_50411 [Saccharata proteae CBS 121410]|uniref:F-box domain-containing protein n=1 Tax=Saccharata proteae CBS 121410 TaxID=1314787 RepID=A0A9P4HLQ3_9PEZI|nr:hypothetical protein K490DRAFT_50411 [Saccharata proteae CBS 121410]
MQPELPNVLNNTLAETHSSHSTVASQHGVNASDLSLPAILHEDGRGDEAVAVDEDTAAVDELSQTRLSQNSPLPRNRIIDHENALSPSPQKKSDGPAFEVIKKQRKPGDKHSPIANLPNELLTHALSHLPPNDLSAVALVSRRLHDLVTTPHAWRVAFSRYFPGPDSLATASDYLASDEDHAGLRSERRDFTRLTALASWRSEYILRTRLLRSLERGKPMQLLSSVVTGRSGTSKVPTPHVDYLARLPTTVNQLHATFGGNLNKRLPAFIHGADDVGMASTSDPHNGKPDNWGLSDPQFFLQFAERHPGDAQWGLGPGTIVGVPNVMDVSQPHGLVHGEGSPGGSIYYRSVEEMRGRFLALPLELDSAELGIPRLMPSLDAVCSIWIAKSATILSLTEGLVGILAGSSSGIVSAYSLGTNDVSDSRLPRGEPTARWVVSPGVPIIGISVDEHYSPKRHAQNRIWCVVLNALGELFYLTKFPKRAHAGRRIQLDEPSTERLAWATGRTVHWNLVEPSRRMARPNPYRDSDMDGSYSPQTSWDGMCLTSDQITAETREVENFIRRKPIDFRTSCLGWDMQRRLEVDFAADDDNNAGESIFVFQCGLHEDTTASARRFTRCRFPRREEPSPSIAEAALKVSVDPPSLFGGQVEPVQLAAPRLSSSRQSSRSMSPDSSKVEEWRLSELSFGGPKAVQISATAIDPSTFSCMTLSEDPVLGFSCASTASSPFDSPFSDSKIAGSAADIPGQRARFVAVGTQTGSVFLWNMRAPISKSAEIVNMIDPIRIIYTDSPQISSLALTALYVVHGGNDGLVQAWDPLASTMQPVRTINSRFSSRARRRLVQAQASLQGVGINMYAAGAICLDPDPTVLRGMVSIGNQLRYWSYSSSAADAYRSKKRNLRRSERGSNNGGGGPSFSASGRSKIKDYIAHERHELEREQIQKQRDADRLAGRFGIDLLEDEDQALAYAALLSAESLENDAKRRQSAGSTADSDSTISRANILTPSSSPPVKGEDELDADIAEAIRLSLELSGGASYQHSDLPKVDIPEDPVLDIPIKYSNKQRKASPSSSARPKVPAAAGGRIDKEMDDLEFALQLSLAEERSRKERNGEQHGDDENLADEFPTLGPAPGSKGKGRAWGS